MDTKKTGVMMRLDYTFPNIDIILDVILNAIERTIQSTNYKVGSKPYHVPRGSEFNIFMLAITLMLVILFFPRCPPIKSDHTMRAITIPYPL